jgi:hypothetical protein
MNFITFPVTSSSYHYALFVQDMLQDMEAHPEVIALRAKSKAARAAASMVSGSAPAPEPSANSSTPMTNDPPPNEYAVRTIESLNKVCKIVLIASRSASALSPDQQARFKASFDGEMETLKWRIQ